MTIEVEKNAYFECLHQSKSICFFYNMVAYQNYDDFVYIKFNNNQYLQTKRT